MTKIDGEAIFNTPEINQRFHDLLQEMQRVAGKDVVIVAMAAEVYRERRECGEIQLLSTIPQNAARQFIRTAAHGIALEDAILADVPPPNQRN